MEQSANALAFLNVPPSFSVRWSGKRRSKLRSKLTDPFFTIGHSTRWLLNSLSCWARPTSSSLSTFVWCRGRAPIHEFNRDMLPIALSEFAIDYEHIAQLGGLRTKSTTVPPSVNAFWQNASFHNYADYAMSEDFKSGLMRLRELGHAKRTAMMCAEAVWWRCHRRNHRRLSARSRR